MTNDSRNERSALLMRTLEETVEEHEFCPEATARRLDRTAVEESKGRLGTFVDQSSTIVDNTGRRSRAEGIAPPVFTRRRLLSKLGSIAPGGPQEADRYKIGEFLGAGANGRVFSVTDDDLSREVAIKVFVAPVDGDPRRARELLKEAQTVARLEHPGIVPIYDVNLTARGEMYFVMRRVRGRALGNMLREAAESGKVPEEIRSTAQLAGVFLKVCDALRYAHHHGIVHQDVKPDNIMVGEFGEVLLLDWGSSSMAVEAGGPERDPQLVGTPAYMSPEQARRERADHQSDVYCVGSSLFHCLLGRYPTLGTDAEQFWQKKRDGRIDLPTKRERVRIPPQLLAITLKALESDVEQRYSSMDELSADLQHFLNGEAISWRHLHDGNALIRSKSYLKKHWLLLSAPRWQSPKECAPGDGAPWFVQGSSLFGKNQRGYDNLSFSSRMAGDIRVQWKVRGVRKAENLNCFILGTSRQDGYTFHINAFDTPGYCVLTKGGYFDALNTAQLPFVPLPGTFYNFRMEKEGGHVRLFIEDQCVFDYEDPDMLSGPTHQTFGFENSSGNVIEIRDISVSHRPVPIILSPLSIPNQYLEDGFYDNALAQFEAIMATYPDSEAAQVAQFKIGVCHLRRKEPDRAIEAFTSFEHDFADHQLVPISMVERARAEALRGKPEASEPIYRLVATRFPGHSILNTIMAGITAKEAQKGLSTPEKLVLEPGTLKRYDQARRTLTKWSRILNISLQGNHLLKFSALHLTEAGMLKRVLVWYPDQYQECAQALRRLGRFEEVLTRYPHLRRTCARTLLELGRAEQVLRDYPEQREACAIALRYLGRQREALRKYPEQNRETIAALVSSGKADEAIARFADDTPYITQAYSYANRISELLHIRSATVSAVSWALHTLGRDTEILERYPGSAEAAEALVRLGRYDEIPADDSRFRAMRAKAIVFTGCYDEALRLYPEQGSAIVAAAAAAVLPLQVRRDFPNSRLYCASSLNMLGRHQEVLSSYPDQRNACARALMQMGRFDETLQRYPDLYLIQATVLIDAGKAETVAGWGNCSMAAAQALIACGRTEESLKRFGERAESVMQALQMAGRHKEVLSRFRHRATDVISALLALDRPGEVLRRYAHDHAQHRGLLQAYATAACRALRVGDTAGAWEHLRQVEQAPFSYEWNDAWFTRFLLGRLARYFAGEIPRSRFRQYCARLASRHRDHFQQAMHFTARYLVGECTDTEFLRQPLQLCCKARLTLAAAIRLDSERNPRAIEYYRAYSEMPQYTRGKDWVETAFVKWRLRQLRQCR